MNYNTMVKEAYEEIMGFDKEAGVLDNAKAELSGMKLGGRLMKDAIKSNPKGVASAIGNRIASRPIGTAAGVAGTALAAYGAKKLIDRGREKREENGGWSPMGGAAGMFRRKKEQPQTGTTITINSPMAKKAAAYYDEAQLVKEAAEADYKEACAYEEAALSILSELGYLD